MEAAPMCHAISGLQRRYPALYHRSDYSGKGGLSPTNAEKLVKEEKG